ncbi:hypothetical protein G7Y89_g3172 [Cudoniella acicularis]|uniref:Uncharacterized protein n=1 Tax=Cudoniella acicularis TaxID=354080 RepID=A0A8H4RRW2_9HELO|nr:hypothetical protein G7Y89_g3172 [Cudoniella acicularis]
MSATLFRMDRVNKNPSNGDLPCFPKEWDKGVFKSELIKNSLFPRAITPKDNDFIFSPDVRAALPEGTFQGTQKAATEMYNHIQSRFTSYFDITNFESTIPQPLELEQKQKLFSFQKSGSDNFPPHLDLVTSPIEGAVNFLEIFNLTRLLDIGLLLPRVILDKILNFINDDPESSTMVGIQQRNREIRKAKKNIGEEPNIGDRDDWFTDAVFAQPNFTGTNPTTICKARDWAAKFQGETTVQGNQKIAGLLKDATVDSLYVQDYSYFRDAVKANEDSLLTSDDGKRFGCASVCLFQLIPTGKLHTLTIVIDYKGGVDKPVANFNKRLSPSDSTFSEAGGWPW